MSDATTIVLALIPTISATVAAIIGMLNNALGRRNERKLNEQAQHIAESKSAIVLLEKNTNSIKDALVKVTAESEYAKGLKVGADAAKAAESNAADAVKNAADSVKGQFKTGPAGPSTPKPIA